MTFVRAVATIGVGRRARLPEEVHASGAMGLGSVGREWRVLQARQAVIIRHSTGGRKT